AGGGRGRDAARSRPRGGGGGAGGGAAVGAPPLRARYARPPPPCSAWSPSPFLGGFTMTAPFPTHKQEEWRYADLDALRPVWEQFAEPVTVTVAPGESLEQVWLPPDDEVQVRRVQLALEQDAKARIFVLNIARHYGRVELEV